MNITQSFDSYNILYNSTTAGTDGWVATISVSSLGTQVGSFLFAPNGTAHLPACRFLSTNPTDPNVGLIQVWFHLSQFNDILNIINDAKNGNGIYINEVSQGVFNGGINGSVSGGLGGF